MNRLYYGDNLDVLRQGKIGQESVDLIYLDPPFNSQHVFNVFLKEQDGAAAASQQQAFLDSWDWPQAAGTYEELRLSGGKISEAMEAFHAFLGESSLLAYLVMMAPRLTELRRVLKPTGSVYLHCDPTASHYLKILMDAIFGPEQFRNEIIWKRTSAHSSAKRYGPVHDVILFYGVSDETKWIGRNQEYESDYVKQRYKRGGERPWRDENITGSGIRHGETGQVWRGFDVTEKGRHWCVPPSDLDKMDTEGRIYWPKKKGGWPRQKVFLADAKGVPLQDVWTDISPVNSQARERKEVGYPTQKPEALLERIVRASSSEGDLVLDPFCGCGTTVAVAQRLERRWLGIDITARAIDIIVDRLRRDYPGIEGTYRVEQYPYSATDARRLANEENSKFHFQRWALERLGVDPSDIKPGADRGIDGKLYFADGHSGRTKRIVLSVKAGQRVGPETVRELRGVLDRDGFEIGALVTVGKLTPATAIEMASGRRHYETTDGRRFLRLQHLTIDDIFAGRTVEYPGADKLKFRRRPIVVTEPHPEPLELDFEESTPAKIIVRPKKAKMAKARLTAKPKKRTS